MQEICILGLGSNMGDRLVHLRDVKIHIQTRIGNIEKVSSIYESEPWGYTDAAHYMNQVITLSTELAPKEILEACMQIECDMGRIRTKPGYESRIIDIDILFYGSCQMELPHLIIPHPRLQLRKFVLEPLQEIVPDFVHPVLKKSIAQLFESCSDKCVSILRSRS